MQVYFSDKYFQHFHKQCSPREGGETGKKGEKLGDRSQILDWTMYPPSLFNMNSTQQSSACVVFAEATNCKHSEDEEPL